MDTIARLKPIEHSAVIAQIESKQTQQYMCINDQWNRHMSLISRHDVQRREIITIEDLIDEFGKNIFVSCPLLENIVQEIHYAVNHVRNLINFERERQLQERRKHKNYSKLNVCCIDQSEQEYKQEMSTYATLENELNELSSFVMQKKNQIIAEIEKNESNSQHNNQCEIQFNCDLINESLICDTQA